MPGERTLALEFLAVGPLSPALVSGVVRRVSRSVAIACRVAAGTEEFDAVPIEGRAQLDADRLLAEVEGRATREGVVLAALAAKDMGSPLFTHFFGRARLGGRALVVSLARLSPAFYGLPADVELTVRRAALEVVHELGHVAGLPHCRDSRCLMHLAHTVDAIDLRGTSWCDACAMRLPPDLATRRRAVV